jgi:hypothetical protein
MIVECSCRIQVAGTPRPRRTWTSSLRMPAAAPFPTSLVGQGVVGTRMPAVTGVKTTKVPALPPKKRSSVITVHAIPAPPVSKITLRPPGSMRHAVCQGFGDKRAACRPAANARTIRPNARRLKSFLATTYSPPTNPLARFSASHLSSFYAADAKPMRWWITTRK